MKIYSLEIKNFKAIQNLKIENLSSLVLIAGGNGVGKSTIFDAIRLVKSSYGEYNQNEIQNWYNEFDIRSGNNSIAFEKVLREKDKTLLIDINLILFQSEKEYLLRNGEKLIQSLLWRSHTNQFVDPENETFISIASQNRAYQSQIEVEASQYYEVLKEELKHQYTNARIEYKSGDVPKTNNSITTEILFGFYTPSNLGIIDYHGAHRNYQRENISTLNVNFTQSDQYRHHTLYNYTNKYNNIKTELASSYIKALISKAAGESEESTITLNNSLNHLFNTFFPGKTFGGVRPQKSGLLLFPVIDKDGTEYDISDLSSGEKEILFGYLRLRNNSPKNSIILIDEPELHLNPKISKKLPEFYYNNIGKALNNQLWLVTHSESILKESIGFEEFSVFHLRQPNKYENQAHKVTIKKDIETAVIDLIGDFASYNENNLVIIFEGENSDFDIKMCCSLFPELETEAMCIPAGKKSNVKTIHKILDKAYQKGILKEKFVSIVDSDNDEYYGDSSFCWDVYHIENYLLSPQHILNVIRLLELEVPADISTIIKIEEALKLIAETDIDFHAGHIQNIKIQKKLISAISFNINYQKENHLLFYQSINNTQELSRQLNSTELNLDSLKQEEAEIRANLYHTLDNREWIKRFRGRDILKKFVGQYIKKVSYPIFRNLVINNMKQEKYKPEGMADIITKILAK